MCQFLVVAYNNTNTPLTFLNYDGSTMPVNTVSIAAGQMFRTDKTFNIPDDSNPPEFYKAQHWAVQDNLNNVLFSFWDNDDDHYNLRYCAGANWEKAQYMPGFFDGGNKATVGIVVSGSPGSYSITACKVLNNV